MAQQLHTGYGFKGEWPEVICPVPLPLAGVALALFGRQRM